MLGFQNASNPVVITSTLKPGATSLMSSQFGMGIIPVETIISEASPAKHSNPAAKSKKNADNSDLI